MCTEGGWDCTTFEFHFILLLIRRWTKSCTLTQSFISGLTGLLVFSSSIEFPFFVAARRYFALQSSCEHEAINTLQHVVIQTTPSGNRSSEFGGRGLFLIFALPYRFVPPQRVWVLLRFGLKTDIDFAYFSLNSGVVFRDNYGSV